MEAHVLVAGVDVGSDAAVCHLKMIFSFDFQICMVQPPKMVVACLAFFLSEPRTLNCAAAATAAEFATGPSLPGLPH